MFARLVFETAVNIRFLVKNFSDEIVEAYLAYSFRHDRRLHDLIQLNIEQRGGVVLPIEDRMLKSIERSVRLANIVLDKVDPDDRADWAGNLYQRAKAVGMDKTIYLVAFGGGSLSVHGNWHDLYNYHLDWVEEAQGFTPELDGPIRVHNSYPC